MLREASAEFAGSMILVIIGTGTISQVVLSSNAAVSPSPKGVSIFY
jgi:aquaglyceroporin related protein